MKIFLLLLASFVGFSTSLVLAQTPAQLAAQVAASPGSAEQIIAAAVAANPAQAAAIVKAAITAAPGSADAIVTGAIKAAVAAAPTQTAAANAVSAAQPSIPALLKRASILPKRFFALST